MAKRSLETESAFTGYLHNISTVSTARNGKSRYFTGSLQVSKTDVRKVVCFKPEQHEKFMAAAGLRSPIKITGASLSPGRNQAVDIIFGRAAAMEVMPTELEFKKKKLDVTEQTASPKDLKSLVEEDVTVSDCVYNISNSPTGALLSLNF